MKTPRGSFNTPNDAVLILASASEIPGRNLQMSGEPHYQPKDLRPYLGYDQRVGWQIIVSWFWMVTLAKHGIMPEGTARLLTEKLLRKLLRRITTTAVKKTEDEITKHDVLALLMHMRAVMPKRLHKWLHLGLTSYDVISTAYALQLYCVWDSVFRPKVESLDELWRLRINETFRVVRIGRTHLQNALPVTVGRWLAVLHNRFARNVLGADDAVSSIPGKFSGAVGTGAAIREVLRESVDLKKGDLESACLGELGLPMPRPSTQITQPEGMARFYFEMVLISGTLENLGDDIRHLQASAIAEVVSASSTSSTMSHKTSNPVAAENMAGMFVSVDAGFSKVIRTLNSNLERDLRWSNVARSFNEILVYVYQQLLTAERTLKTFKVNEAACSDNFRDAGTLIMAELLHLSLQKAGWPDAHTFVNKTLVPNARVSGRNLAEEMGAYLHSFRQTSASGREASRSLAIWKKVPERIKTLLANPEEYIGDSHDVATEEAITPIWSGLGISLYK